MAAVLLAAAVGKRISLPNSPHPHSPAAGRRVLVDRRPTSTSTPARFCGCARRMNRQIQNSIHWSTGARIQDGPRSDRPTRVMQRRNTVLPTRLSRKRSGVLPAP